MRPRLSVGVVVAVLGGLLFAAILAAVGSADRAQTVIHVPASAVGDHIVYARFVREPVADDAAALTAWESAGMKAIRLQQGPEFEARDGTLRQTLLVREDYTGKSGRGYTKMDHVDLASGRSLRTTTDYDVVENNARYKETHFHLDGSAFFPHERQTYKTDSDIRWRPEQCLDIYPTVTWLYSDRQVADGVGAVGGEIRLRAWHDDCSGNMTYVNFFGPVERISGTAYVAGTGSIDGRSAIDVRSVTEFRVTDFAFGELVTDELYGETVTRVRDEWVSADSPYPLLEQDEYFLHTDGGLVYLFGRQYALQSFTPGTQPVAWDGTVRQAPAPERTRTDEPFPTDGTGSSLVYPLTQALLDLETPTAPPQWRAWSTLNPDSTLVSAELSPGEHSTSPQPSHQWTLVYSTPAGAAHEIVVERFRGRDVALRDGGDKTVPPFDPATIPTQQLTLAAVEEKWKQLASRDFRSRPPNFAHWGYVMDYTESPACMGSWGAGAVQEPELELHTVYLGYSSVGACVDTNRDIDISLVVVDSASGENLLLHEMSDGFPSRPALAGDAKAANVEAVPSVPPWSPPDVRVAAIASASLFALFLTVYLAPALKALAGHLGLVPGYARIRKDEILESKVRDQIMELVKHEPGLSMSELVRKTGAGWGNIVHHVGVLEQHDLVATQTVGGHRRVFPSGRFDPRSQQRLAVLKSARARMLWELVSEEPGAMQLRLARRAGLSAPSTYWHLRRLESAGLVERIREGRNVRYFASDHPKGQPPSGIELV